MRNLNMPEDQVPQDSIPPKIEISSFSDLPEEVRKEMGEIKEKISGMINECRLQIENPDSLEAHINSIMTHMAFQAFQMRSIVNQLEMHHIAIPELAKAIDGKADKLSW